MVFRVEAVIYTRVSSDQNEGRSVKDQERECRAWCDSRGHTVRASFSDNNIGASRWSGKERPGWAAAKRELRPKDLLVVWEASRGYRDMEEFVVFRNLAVERGITLAYSGRVYDFSDSDDRFVGGLDALMAERESDKIRERVMRGQHGGRLDGRPHARPPWGYQRVERATWIPDPVEAPRVREAARRLLEGESQRAVYHWLVDTGWAPSSGTSFQRIILNPAYAGLRVHRGEVLKGVRGNWEPLLTEDQHYRLVGMVKMRKRLYGGSPPGREPKYLLSLIATCGRCGLGLHHSTFGGAGDFYRCPRSHCKRRMADMDAAVEAELFKILVGIDPADYAEVDDAEVLAGFARIEEIERDIQSFREKAIKREISADSFAAIEQGMLAEVDALNEKLAGGRRPSALSSAEIVKSWPHVDIRQRRDTIKALLRVTAIPGPGRGIDGGLLIERI